MAASPVVRFRVYGIARLLGVAAAAAILFWVVHFRGGMALSSVEDKLLIFNVHPVLMVISLVALNGEALLAYKTVPGTKKLKKLVHLALQFLAMLLSLTGLCAVWKFHDERKIDHLYTLHSWLGLSCITLFGLQWATGLWTFWYPGGSRSGRAFLLPWHVFFGVFIYVLAIATSITGLLEKSIFMQSAKMIGRFSTEALFMNSVGMLLVLLSALVILAIVSPGTGSPCADGDQFGSVNGEALLAYKTVPGTKKLKKLVHLALQFLAMLLSLTGLCAVWKFHDERKIDHLYTLHSWLGLSCITFFGLQWATGLRTFWYPGGSRSGRAFLLPWHVFFGVFIYVLAIATSITGLLEKSIFMQSAKMIGRFSTEALFMNSVGMLLVLLSALVILAIVSPGTGRINTDLGYSE